MKVEMEVEVLSKAKIWPNNDQREDKSPVEKKGAEEAFVAEVEIAGVEGEGEAKVMEVETGGAGEGIGESTGAVLG
jgi:hypothetical protein